MRRPQVAQLDYKTGGGGALEINLSRLSEGFLFFTPSLLQLRWCSSALVVVSALFWVESLFLFLLGPTFFAQYEIKGAAPRQQISASRFTFLPTTTKLSEVPSLLLSNFLSLGFSSASPQAISTFRWWFDQGERLCFGFVVSGAATIAACVAGLVKCITV